jgi:hypothetical protein
MSSSSDRSRSPRCSDPFDPTEYEDRSPSPVRTPEPLRVQRAREMQRLGRQAALDAELQREWEEMYRMFAHDVVEQQHLADLLALIE